MSVRHHLAWMGISQACSLVLQFAGSVLIARLLAPYDVGVFTIAMAITSLLGAIQSFGLSGFVVREPNMSCDLLATTFTVNAAIAVLLAALVVACSQLGAAFLHEPGVAHVMLLLAAVPLFGAFEFLPASNLERESDFKTIGIINAGRVLVSQSVTMALALCGFSYMSLAYGQVAAAICSAVGYCVVGARHTSLRLCLTEWRRVTRFGVQMLAISGVNNISWRAADFVLGRALGLSALGLYSRASSLNALVWDNIHLVIGRVVFVDLAAQKRAGASLRESYLRIVEVLTALLWPAFAGLSIVAGPFILAVYGARWVAAAHPLVMLSLASMVLVAITMTWEIFVVCGETGRQARIEVYRTGVGLALFAAGCIVSLTGAAAARIGEALFSVSVYRPHLDRMTQTHTRDFLGIYLRSALLTAGAVAPAGLLMAAYHASERTPLVYVVAAVALGAAIWLALIMALDHPLAQEIRRSLAGRGRAAVVT